MTTDKKLAGNTSTESTDQLNKNRGTASQTEVERIADLLNSTLTQELEALRTRLNAREERGATRRKILNPKNLAFDSPADEAEGEADEDT